MMYSHHTASLAAFTANTVPTTDDSTWKCLGVGNLAMSSQSLRKSQIHSRLMRFLEIVAAIIAYPQVWEDSSNFTPQIASVRQMSGFSSRTSSSDNKDEACF